MKDENKDAKHENKRGITISNNSTNQVLSTPITNPSIAPRTSHQMSNCTQSDEREVVCNEFSEKFRSQSSLKQHLRSHSSDVSSWQRDYPTEDTQLRYWKDKLLGHELLDLITDYPRQCQIKYAAQNIYFELDGDMSMNLRKLAKYLKVSLYTVLMSGYYLMLRIYSNQDDLVIGTLAANSHFSWTGKMIEIFGNKSAIRIQTDPKYLLKDFIKQVDGDISESHVNQNLPFEKLVKEFAVAKDQSRHPIFQVMFGLQNFGINLQNQTDAETDLADFLELQRGKSPHNVAKLDLTTIIDDSGSVLKGLFNYSTSLYREETIHRFKDTFVHILSQLSMLLDGQTKAEHTTIADLSYLNAEQYHQIVHSWNATDKEYPADKTIHQIFEEQVAKTPDNIAIVYEEVQLTYRELNERANQLAYYLIADFQIEPDSLIPLCLDRSEYMIIAILAVFKSGGAYVPIDPSYPDERIQYILQDTCASLFLTDEIHEARLERMISVWCSQKNSIKVRQPWRILSLNNQEFKEKVLLQDVTNPNSLTTSAHLACIIYTSGTTGKPKGVLVEHRGLVNLNFGLIFSSDLNIANEDEVILQFSNYTFIASLQQVVLGLLNGYVLLLVPNQLWLEEEKFNNYLILHNVTHIHSTPRFLEQHNFREISSLKRVICGGEVLHKQSYDRFAFNQKLNIINVYGLTETSGSSTLNLVHRDSLNNGSPLANTKCYVLNENLVPLPIGAIGDLYIGGEGLARGYLNRPDLTSKRFIVNCFQTEGEKGVNKNSRLYKTGDLVRWLPDGNLEYLGRNDFQVKIRGYRIELGEIESTLLGYKGIKQSVVLAKEHKNAPSKSPGSKYLVGYYVSDARLEEETIFRYLESKLPEYMVPVTLVHIDELPLTINGKLDRKALPDPQFTQPDNYVAPRNQIEEKTCQILAELLGLNANKVGIHDDFFRLGGDSIMSIQLVSRLRKILQLNVSVKDIFLHKSIARLYENVLSAQLSVDRLSSLQTEQGILIGAVPLLPVQEWFFCHNFSAPHHWNQSVLLKTPMLDLGKLKDSLEKLIQHHDSFTLRYRKAQMKNSYEQYYDGYAKVEPIKILDVSILGYPENSQAFKANLQQVLTDWQANFDLTDGPLYSVGYIYGYKDSSARVFFGLHHLIVDAISWRILSEDLKDLYDGKILGKKGSSYRQWSDAVKKYPRKHQGEQLYWINILSDYDRSVLNTFTVNESTAHYTNIELSQEYTTLLMQESNRAYNTQISDILLTALGYSLKEIFGCSINHIALEGHGREEIDNTIDISRTLGWFTTMYPVRLEITDSLGTSIKSIKESLRAIPNKGLGYGPVVGYESNAFPRISFNYQGQLGQENSAKLSDKGFWQITEEDSGISMNPNNWEPNVINITGRTTESRLGFIIKSKLDEEATNNLGSVFKEQLEVVINHAINQPRSYLTVSDVGHIISKERLDALQEQREVENIYLANSLQQGFIYHALSQENVDDAYIVQFIWEYHYSLNINHLKQAWEFAKDKFSSLRLRFDWQDDLVQIVDKEGCLDWRYMELKDELSIEKQENKIREIQEKDRVERYDLAKGSLFRIYVIKQNRDLYRCILSNHHAILDGWSMPILLGYIHDTYLRLDSKELIIVQPDYSYEIAQRFMQEHKEDHKAFWDAYIGQVEERCDFSGLLLSNEKRLSEYKHILHSTDETLAITGDLYSSLKLLSQQEGVTLNAILQYVWHKVLSVYGNSKQTIVGTTLSGRSLPVDDIEKSVGLYVNTLPLIVNHQASKSLIESVRDIQASISELNSRSIINLAKLQSSSERLFDSLFVYQNYPNRNNLAQDKFKLKFKGYVEKLDYPLNVRAYELNNELIFNLEYAGELFGKETIDDLLQLTRLLLEQLAADAYQVTSSLKFLNAHQYDQIIHSWNATDKEYPAFRTIHELFEEQVAKTPDNVAVVYEEVKLTYRELNERANQLASYLIAEFHIEPDSLIPLCLDRSEYMIIAILALFKSGGAYVPIDPSYPDDRIQYILQDTCASLLLTNEIHKERLEDMFVLDNTNQECLEAKHSPTILSLDSLEFQAKLLLQAVTNLNIIVTSAHLAYVIYTSGTTGKPKGVMVEHRGLVNLNCDLSKRYALADGTEREVILQFYNYVFDASVEQIILALLNGHALLLVPNQLWVNKEKFNNYLLLNNVTHIAATPRFLEQQNFSEILSLKRIICGGDVLSKHAYDNIRFNDTIKIVNVFGPTETSVLSTVNIVREGNLNIGSPISNTQCYVLDDNLRPLPIGAVGDLYIGGVGLARGYLNKPDLTAERFISNHFQTAEERRSLKNARLYKTGDLVRWLPDGNLEYIGRNDFQVKIRGYRIELGEIESSLIGYKGIKQSVVLAKKHRNDSSGFKYLVGYYVSDTRLDEEAILCYLESKLPKYMVPVMLVHIDELPFSFNGKIDIKALPDPEFTCPDNHGAPRNKIEEKACQIWAEVLELNVDEVFIHDDFFQLGGDSITIIQMVGRLRKRLQLNVSVTDILKYRSIAKLSENVFKNNLSIGLLSCELIH